MQCLWKLKPMIDMGGVALPLFKIADKFFGSELGRKYQYSILANAAPEDYPRLLGDLYRIAFNEKLELEAPRTFNEKIQWMKLYDATPEKTRLADKYLVRSWVREKIGEQYLIPLLGVWDRFDAIDFESLPDAFFLKCNHGSSMNLAVKKKSELDVRKARARFQTWMGMDYAFRSLELQYRGIPRKILAEAYCRSEAGPLTDYKFFVIHGEPRMIHVIGERNLERHTAKECFLTLDWVPREPLYHTYTEYDTIPEKPENLDKMLEIAGKLGEGFRFVRVDLYNLDGEIKFGEMTFTPASGFGKWDGEEQYTVGSWIHLE